MSVSVHLINGLVYFGCGALSVIGVWLMKSSYDGLKKEKEDGGIRQ